MYFRQYDLAGLSLYSYLVGDTTTSRAVVVVDPQREISEYLADPRLGFLIGLSRGALGLWFAALLVAVDADTALRATAALLA